MLNEYMFDLGVSERDDNKDNVYDFQTKTHGAQQRKEFWTDKILSDIEKTGKSVLSGLTEGLDLGALSEDFLNPVLDLATIGTGIGSLISGISKKKKEQKQLEETQKQGIGNVNVSPTQLTAASTINPSQIISQSANQSF